MMVDHFDITATLRYAKLAEEPTDDEYEEARANDIDPETFDRATYRRLRNSLTHEQIIHAQQSTVAEHGVRLPLEDLETGMINHEGHFGPALDEASAYLNRYRGVIRETRNWLHFPPRGVSDQDASRVIRDRHREMQGGLLTKEQHDSILTRLFNHHSALRDRQVGDGTMRGVTGISTASPDEMRDDEWDSKDYPRAHSWILSEINKLDPDVKRDTSVACPSPGCTPSRSSFSTESVHPHSCYEHLANALAQHYATRLVFSSAYQPGIDPDDMNQISGERVRQHVVANRKMRAVNNISQSAFYPYGYSVDKYEE